MTKEKQRLLFGEGTVEDLEKNRRMFQMLAEAFCRPIIVQRGCEADVTEKQKLLIRLARAKQIGENKGNPIDMATDYEAMLYLSTASLTAPLSPVYNRIYFHLFKKFYPEKSDFIPDHEAQLNIQAEYELKNLKRWLYRQSKKK